MKKLFLFVIVFICIQFNALAQWTFKTPMPTGRGFTSGTVVDGKIYMIGGFPTHNSVTTANEMYDPVTDSWAVMDTMPEGRCAMAVCTYDGKIYVFGGVSPGPYASAKKQVYVYDPQTNTWAQKADMPNANAFCGIAVVNDTIYLVGGMLNYAATPVSTVMAYYPLMDTWAEKEPMLTARGMLSACTVDGKIYAIGGTINFISSSFNIVEVYDPATNTWATKTSMPTARVSLATCVMDGKIYAVGGYDYPEMYTVNEMYDPALDTWVERSPMQETRQTFFLGSVGDKIYAIGGSYPNPQNPNEPIILSSVEEYDTSLDPTTQVEVDVRLFEKFTLMQNYPNPFNPSTTISWQSPVGSWQTLKIYDGLGSEVATLVDEYRNAGNYEVKFDARNLPSGVYLYKLRAGSFIQTKKMILLR